ncbi:MAG: extensin family protein [Rhizobiales bacterium]|nr:extensin family protein [Hyphomicrobiales bacterium]
MNFSADGVARKWSSGVALGRNLLVPALAAAVLMVPEMAVAGNSVPLPRPRPADALKAEPAPPSDEAAKSGQQPDETKPEASAPLEEKPPEPSACRLALTETIAIAPSIPPIKGPGACGGDDLVRLEAVVLPDTRKVPVSPPAVLRCTMATAIADWIRADMVPLATSLGTKLSELDNFDSYECRGRNRVRGARLSEHGLANALDVRSLKLADGSTISLTDRKVPRETREAVLHSVCARFMTVLGPSSDWYHEDHIHLDLAERRNNYKICQWGVYDPLPDVAPLMPAERPEEAPPRLSDEEKAALERPPVSSSAKPDENTPAPETVEEEPKPPVQPSEKPSRKKPRK